MAIKKADENVLMVDLPHSEPRIAGELKKVNQIVSSMPACSVLVDFSQVDILTSSSLSNLLILRKWLVEHGGRLFLCGVSFPTKCIFTVAGLDRLFDFVAGKSEALAAVKAGQKATAGQAADCKSNK